MKITRREFGVSALAIVAVRCGITKTSPVAPDPPSQPPSAPPAPPPVPQPSVVVARVTSPPDQKQDLLILVDAAPDQSTVLDALKAAQLSPVPITGNFRDERDLSLITGGLIVELGGVKQSWLITVGTGAICRDVASVEIRAGEVIHCFKDNGTRTQLQGGCFS